MIDALRPRVHASRVRSPQHARTRTCTTRPSTTTPPGESVNFVASGLSVRRSSQLRAHTPCDLPTTRCKPRPRCGGVGTPLKAVTSLGQNQSDNKQSKKQQGASAASRAPTRDEALIARTAARRRRTCVSRTHDANHDGVVVRHERRTRSRRPPPPSGGLHRLPPQSQGAHFREPPCSHLHMHPIRSPAPFALARKVLLPAIAPKRIAKPAVQHRIAEAIGGTSAVANRYNYRSFDAC